MKRIAFRPERIALLAGVALLASAAFAQGPGGPALPAPCSCAALSCGGTAAGCSSCSCCCTGAGCTKSCTCCTTTFDCLSPPAGWSCSDTAQN